MLHSCENCEDASATMLHQAALKLKEFFSTKIPFRDELESDDSKLTRFPFDSLWFSNLWGKEQLVIQMPDDFSVKNNRAPC